MVIHVNNMDYNIKDLVSNLDFKSLDLVDCGNNIFLTNKEISVLKKYNINYGSCINLKEILSKIEDIFYSEEEDLLDDLEDISLSIAERDYYQNTNK